MKFSPPRSRTRLRLSQAEERHWRHDPDGTACYALAAMALGLLAFALAIALALGGRAQLLVARFADGIARTAPLLATALLAAIASAIFAAWAGSTLAMWLPPGAAEIFAVGAIALAASALMRPVRVRAMAEPTRSFVAIGIVLIVRQLYERAGLALFTLALLAYDPVPVAVGGALGSSGAAALGWWAGLDRIQRLPLGKIRIAQAIVCAFIAAAIGWRALYPRA